MKKIIVSFSFIFCIVLISGIIFNYTSEDASQKSYAKELVKEGLSKDATIADYKILSASEYGEYRITDAATLGLPAGEVDCLEIKVQAEQTNVDGETSEQSYYHTFFRQQGDDEWQYGHALSAVSDDGIRKYELEKYE
ncbi:hypothetical protein SFC66_12280 [Terribacillus saccharophilus]|uniref:hypothetical protein n=1 Tax=Terribacillus saccharophilus TaxID=361277 RepID=UPI0039822E70